MRLCLRHLTLPLLAGAAACSTTFTPTVVSASEANVTYRIPPEKLEATRKAADDYCKGRGRTARLDRVTPTGEGRSVAVFTCY